MFTKGKILICIIGILFLFSSSSVLAHDQVIEDPFYMSLGDDPLTVVHEDGGEFKGTLTLTLSNNGTDPWGDFHFYSLTEGVYFTEFDGKPNMNGAMPYTYDIDPEGEVLSFYFYDDPVYFDEEVTFNLYTDNTSLSNQFFSIAFEPSPVPIPGAVWLLGTALASTMAIRKKIRIL